VGNTNGNQLVTGLTKPVDVAVDLNGSLYVADTSQTSVLAANRARPVTSFPNTNLNTSNSDPLNVTNTGNASLNFVGATLTTGTGSTAVFAVTSNTSNGCSTTASVAPGSACGLTATFTPVAKGTFSETMSLVTNAANVANSGALLTGTGVFLSPTSLIIGVTPTGTLNYAEAVTVSITVAPNPSVGTAPTGTVKITVDGKLQTQTLPASGIVTVTLNPAVGTHAISASYGGDTNYASSSNSYSFTVLKAVTATTLSMVVGQSGSVPALTFTATVSSTTATGETGTVSFYAAGGTILIGTATVNTSGVASYTTPNTVYAAYSFTAVYSGDANFAGTTSAVVAPKPDFTVVPSATIVTVPQGGVATLMSSITPLFNYTGTMTASCSGLPVDSVCRFSPVSLALSGTTTQTFNVYIYTNVNPSIASLEMPGRGGEVLAARMIAWPMAAFVVMMLRRRKAWGSRMRLLSLAAMVLVLGGLNGCGGPATPPASSFVTPTGNSTVSVTYSDGNGASHTVNYSFTVNAVYPLP